MRTNLNNSILRRAINGVRKLPQHTYFHRSYRASVSPISSPLSSISDLNGFYRFSPNQLLKYNSKFFNFSSRFIHSAQAVSDSETDDDDSTMSEFLSRFVWIMRKKLNSAYPGHNKDTIDGMLLIIVEKVSAEMERGGLEQVLGEGVGEAPSGFSVDLWRTVWEVSNSVLDDMHKARRKEKLKGFLQSEEVKEMYRFAGEIGIRGDMLRELRFKWAREKMEESEFYESLEKVKEEDAKSMLTIGEMDSVDGGEDEAKVVSLPKRHGKIKYKIYGLDLSDKKWSEVADKVHDAEAIIAPQELKPISGKCKIVTEKILSLPEDSDPAPLLAEWVELLQPSKIDWMSLLDKIKEQNANLYLKIAEHVLGEETFEANIRDYSKLIDEHTKENRLEDAERILKKMNDNGIVPDALALVTMVRLYVKTGNIKQAEMAFESLENLGFPPDEKMYNSMIMTYLNAGIPKKTEPLFRKMEARNMTPPNEVYLALLKCYAQCGDIMGARKTYTLMQLAGIQPSVEAHTILIEAFGKAGYSDAARDTFNFLINQLGHKPDDRCMASMIAAYEKKNELDSALELLVELEKDGFKPGVATYTVLVDWLSKLQLIDEVEQVIDKIAKLGEAPPFKVNISLCAMYARAGLEKKALQALSVVEAKKDQLEAEDFDRVISGLEAGGFLQDAMKIRELREAQGLAGASLF